jgi:hypothetical protein
MRLLVAVVREITLTETTTMRYGRDPYWTTAKYDGKAQDGTPVKRGDRIFYYPNDRTMLVGERAEQAARDFAAARFDESGY